MHLIVHRVQISVGKFPYGLRRDWHRLCAGQRIRVALGRFNSFGFDDWLIRFETVSIHDAGRQSGSCEPRVAPDRHRTQGPRRER